MNIDKDIERCKELIKTEHSNWIGMSNQDAIENVLSELETYKKMAYFLGARYWLKDCEYDLDKFNNLEEIIDWARKEVEKDE